MTRRPIALLTDFGTGDPYVAAMKGVIHSLLPGAVIADITHEIPRHDVVSAAYSLHCVEGYFPKGTIFVCVVDPGVGTARPILCLEKDRRTFLAPGNGVLNHIATGAGTERWYELRLPRKRESVSATFHGRDLFAPAAARLAGGVRLRTIARPVDPVPLRPLFTDLPAEGPVVLKGTVLHIDHFGNVITSIRLGERSPGEWSVRIGGKTIRGACRTYDEAAPRKPFLIRGSSGLLEISVRRGDAAAFLRISRGSKLTLRIV